MRLEMAIDPGVATKGTWGRPLGGVHAAHIEGELDERLAEIREANAHLVLVAVRAQELTEEAEKTSRLKDDFLATVSHEIRTPLSAVLGWARLLGSKRLSPERALWRRPSTCISRSRPRPALER